MDALDPAAYVTSSELEEALSRALKQQEEALGKHEEALRAQAEALSAAERSLQECSEGLSNLEGRVEPIADDLCKLVEQMKEVEVSPSLFITPTLQLEGRGEM